MVVATVGLVTDETQGDNVGPGPQRGDDVGQLGTSVLPSVDETIAAIAREAVCGSELARQTYAWIACLTERARQSPDGTTIVTVEEMATQEYGVYSVIAPHGLATPQAGKAWSLISLRLTQTSEDELGLLHDARNDACMHIILHGVNRPV